MKKLALASAILLAVTGSAIAATQTTDTTAQNNAQSAVQTTPNAAKAGFNDGTNQTQNNTMKAARDGKHRGKHHDERCDGSRDCGFIDNNLPVTKASEIGNLKDNDRIALEGVIEKQVGKKDYMFKDDSGTIEVEINRRAWAGQEITPNDKVKLFGEVDKSWNKTEVEIYRVLKVQ